MKTKWYAVAVVTVASALCLEAQQASKLETPPVLKAADVAPGDVPLQGARYRVDDEAPTDGYLATFTVRTDFGTVQVRGPDSLRRCVTEVDALAELETMKKSDVFASALKRSASSLGGAMANVVTNTAEVAKAVPASVGRFFDRTARAAKTAAQKLGDVKEGREPGAARGAEESTNAPNLAVAAGASTGRAARDILGYDEQRRHLAKKLGVDPYTTNPLLAKKLDEIAWAAFAGGLGVDVLAASVPGGRLVKSTSTLTEWIYEKPPGDLRVWMDKTLTGMGVDRETVDLFLRLKAFTLSTQVGLVMALDRLKGVSGRARVLESAVTLESEEQARFLVLSLSMLAREHEAVPLTEIVEGRPMGITREGRLVFCAAVDYLSWTQRTAELAAREDLVARKPVLMICGAASPVTRRELKSLGWGIVEQAPLAGTF